MEGVLWPYFTFQPRIEKQKPQKLYVSKSDFAAEVTYSSLEEITLEIRNSQNCREG
jgi:hypothetical protein